MTHVRHDQRKHRSPFPFDWRANEHGLIGPQWRGLDGDANDSDKIRLRTRTGHLIQVVRSGAAAITADNGVSVTMPPGFPRLNDDGCLMEASETEYGKIVDDSGTIWPWTPTQMIGDDGFTVFGHFEEGGTISDAGNVVGLFNFGEAGAAVATQPSFEVFKGDSGNEIYQARLNHASGALVTAADAYANAAITATDEVLFLAGVSRSGGNLDVFFDAWVNGTRLTSAPFLAGAAARTVPSAWQDETAAINARDDGSEVGTNTFKRLCWDQGVWQGTTGLAHFGVTL